MNERKKRVESFILSHLDSKIESGALIVGGTGQTPNSPMATTNNNNCTNTSYDSCNKSTNKGNCMNTENTCNNSKNNGSCNNGVKPIITYNDPATTSTCG